jgi:hypothetical protein
MFALKSEMSKQVAQIFKMDISKGCTAYNSLFGRFVLAHSTARMELQLARIQ